MLKDLEQKPLAAPLLRWFAGHARVLPWREEPSPYRVWVSEIMLQQTRVEAVKPYFERFTGALPTVADLAVCPEDELLKLWEGLGYYNRVRNMQRAAVQVMEEYDGRLPDTYDELLALKGIGHYTAGAIASIAYGRYVPAVDGNVLRVIARVTADDTDIMRESFKRAVEEELSQVLAGAVVPEELRARLPQGNVPGAFNQALMELGAMVCLPNGTPLCGECPWEKDCLARRRGCIATLPVRSRAKARRREERTVLIIRDGDKVAIRKRPDRGLLAGLYELPNVEGHMDEDEVLSVVKGMYFAPLRIQRLKDARHIFSHIEWQMWGYAILVEEEGMRDMPVEGDAERAELLFVDSHTASERYAIPAAFAAYAEYIDIKLGNERFEG